MSAGALAATAQALVSAGKGLLAMDESTPTCDRRLAAVGIAQTVDARRAWRELLVTTSGLGDCISGAILHDETIRQQDRHGVLMVERLVDAGIMPGIKVDLGAKPLALHPGERVTEGLDGLRTRLGDYALLGARFAKWRGVIALARNLPSLACIKANAQALARYAALCQEAGLVPIVEPEVLMTGNHTLELCRTVTGDVLAVLFDELAAQDVALDGLILKPNMVLPGLDSPEQASLDRVAVATIACLLQNVPAEVAGIAFLSGGQSAEQASARLNALNLQARSADRPLPWPLVFSFARAIQLPALELWRGDDAYRDEAQEALHHRALCNQAALRGEYDAALDRQAWVGAVHARPTGMMTAGMSSL